MLQGIKEMRRFLTFGTMSGNSFGKSLVLTTYGESHGDQIGGILDGVPAGIALDIVAVQHALDRRRPGQSTLTTQRDESDVVRFHSGLFEGKTTGTPIGFSILNKDQQSADYDALKKVLRPSHADFTYAAKYGHRDHRGGGRASARETATRVVAGAIAAQIIPDVHVVAYTSAVGSISLDKHWEQLDLSKIDGHPTRCPDPEMAEEMSRYINFVREEQDSTGGVVSVVTSGVPAGWGEPVFDKLQADLGKALFSINAVKGVEIGSGFRGAQMRGSQHNDSINKDFSTATNNAGGIVGGISNGAAITARVAFKPVATIGQKQKTATTSGKETTLAAAGRHDPCVVPRAVPIVEAMVYLVLADHYLRNLKHTI